MLMNACSHVDALPLRAISRVNLAQWLMKRKRQWWRRIGRAISSSPMARSLACGKLLPRLLTVADTVVGTERNLLAIRQEDFLTALHHVLLVKGPGVHEVLQHDHEDVLSKGAQIKPIRQATGGARKSELLRSFL